MVNDVFSFLWEMKANNTNMILFSQRFQSILVSVFLQDIVVRWCSRCSRLCNGVGKVLAGDDDGGGGGALAQARRSC